MREKTFLFSIEDISFTFLSLFFNAHLERAPLGAQDLLSFIAQPRFRRLNKIDFTRFSSHTTDPLNNRTNNDNNNGIINNNNNNNNNGQSNDSNNFHESSQLAVLRSMDFSHLTELHLSACAALTDDALANAVLAHAHSLRILDLVRCHNLVRIDGAALDACAGLEELRVCEMHGLEAIRIEAPCAARLRVVVAQRCLALRVVSVHCPELERVSLVQCMH